MGFGEFLKNCRTGARMNQSDLAAELGMNQSDVSKIENGSRIPDADVFRDWTVTTQSMELGIAFLYGTELLTAVPEIMTTVASTVTGFINMFGGWL